MDHTLGPLLPAARGNGRRIQALRDGPRTQVVFHHPAEPRPHVRGFHLVDHDDLLRRLPHSRQRIPVGRHARVGTQLPAAELVQLSPPGAALGGASLALLDQCLTYSDINDAETAINEAFDACAEVCPCP